jgi:hypothetical protein
VALPDPEAPRPAGELRSTHRRADEMGNDANRLILSAAAAARFAELSSSCDRLLRVDIEHRDPAP